MGYITPTGDSLQNNGRPGMLYRFDEKQFRKAIENKKGV